jgi:hypothetical protein
MQPGYSSFRDSAAGRITLSRSMVAVRLKSIATTIAWFCTALKGADVVWV